VAFVPESPCWIKQFCSCLSSSTNIRFQSTENNFHQGSNPGQLFEVVTFFLQSPHQNKLHWSWRCSSIMLSFRATETTFTRNRTVFRGCGLCSRNLLAETNNFGLDTVLLLCLVSELQKPPSPGIELRTVFRGCGLYSCNLLSEINKFGLGAVLLSCLVYKLQKPSSSGIELKTAFRGSGLRFRNLLFETNNSGLASFFYCV
jgi:hypothetical protein